MGTSKRPLGPIFLVVGALLLGACTTTRAIDRNPEGVLYPIFDGTGPGTIVYVHGYMASVASSSSVLEHLKQFGPRVYAFELPGHGQAPGVQYDIHEFSDYGRALASGLGDIQDLSSGPLYLVAHSLGAVAVLGALSQGVGADGILLVAPLFQIRNAGLTTLGVNIVAPFTRILPGGTPVSWFRAYQRWRRQGLPISDRLPRTIIVASENDTVVSNRTMRNAAATFGQIEYREIPNLGHWEIDSYDSTSPLWHEIDRAIQELMTQGRKTE